MDALTSFTKNARLTNIVPSQTSTQIRKLEEDVTQALERLRENNNNCIEFRHARVQHLRTITIAIRGMMPSAAQQQLLDQFPGAHITPAADNTHVVLHVPKSIAMANAQSDAIASDLTLMYFQLFIYCSVLMGTCVFLYMYGVAWPSLSPMSLMSIIF